MELKLPAKETSYSKKKASGQFTFFIVVVGQLCAQTYPTTSHLNLTLSSQRSISIPPKLTKFEGRDIMSLFENRSHPS